MQMLQKGYTIMKGGCIILNVYANLYCYVNIIPHSEYRCMKFEILAIVIFV